MKMHILSMSLIVGLFANFPSAITEDCERTSPCRCRTLSGDFIDIGKIGSIIQAKYPHGREVYGIFYEL